MSLSETEYYRARANEERAAALASNRQDVAEIHRDLAKQYQALVDQEELRPTLRMVRQDRVSVEGPSGVRVNPVVPKGGHRANHAKGWTAEEIDHLRGAILAGETIPRIAATIGRSQEAIRRKASVLDLFAKKLHLDEDG